MTGVNVARPVLDRPEPGEAAYVQADLTSAGDAFAVVPGHDTAVPAAAIPKPTRNAPHTVSLAQPGVDDNVLEVVVRLGVTRFVNISPKTVQASSSRRPVLPVHVPVDEEHPVAPQDPYALSKHFG